jgi:hypothetical protein
MFIDFLLFDQAVGNRFFIASKATGMSDGIRRISFPASVLLLRALRANLSATPFILRASVKTSPLNPRSSRSNLPEIMEKHWQACPVLYPKLVQKDGLS